MKRGLVACRCPARQSRGFFRMNKRKRFAFRHGATADWLRRGMQLPFILASVVCSLAYADTGGESVAKKSGARKLGLSIQVQGGGWGR